MKFLCVPCDTQMRLRTTEESEPGSLAVAYECPECGYEIAMLTNQHETDMVRSLGVRIGPAAAAAIANPSPASAGSTGATGMGAMAAMAAGTAGAAPAGRCPFSAMLGGTNQATQPDAVATAAPSGPEWTPGALARLEGIPEMVRPMARAGIEMVARENGQQVIDEAVLAEARTRFGM
ncbi:MAG TPA: PCP reductase family protein [Thermoanaerobaculia bacterium]|nr:PCP reductase family protein [Thermoanaerobaculia bacterium]